MPAAAPHASASRPRPLPGGVLAAPPLVALCGWAVPGSGYWLIGEKARATIAGTVILATFLAGLLIGGIRVVDVPGYDAVGNRRMLTNGRRPTQIWALTGNPVGEVMNKPWYIAQSLAGPVLMVAGTFGSLKAAAGGHLMSTARLFDIGTLYTAVAGMLNLLVVIDATYRAANPPPPERQPSPQPRPPAPPAEGSPQDHAVGPSVPAGAADSTGPLP